MNAPFFKFGMFGEEVGLVLAFAIGIGFGFALERAGFGSAKKLVSQFYLDDLAVFKVMFTAIVTAMLGVTYLAWMGVLDLSLVFVNPTYLGRWSWAAWCSASGSSSAATVPGRRSSAMVTGTPRRPRLRGGHARRHVRLRRAVPVVRDFFYAGSMGAQTLPGYFGLPWGVVASRSCSWRSAGSPARVGSSHASRPEAR